MDAVLSRGTSTLHRPDLDPRILIALEKDYEEEEGGEFHGELIVNESSNSPSSLAVALMWAVKPSKALLVS